MNGLLVEEFEQSHSHSYVLKEIPLFVIMNYDVSLYGTANGAARGGSRKPERRKE